MSNPPKTHSWNVSPAEARRIQESLRTKVIKSGGLSGVKFVAGADVGFEDNGKIARAAVAVLSFPALELVEYRIARRPVKFPYVPGLLSFREVPVVLDAMEKLTINPNVLLCDGQGYAHPRRFGLACHIGVLTGQVTIGVAKSRLIGSHTELPNQRGSSVALLDKNEKIGRVLRTRTGVRPVYVSIGHNVSLTAAVRFVFRCAPRYRLPETTRWADRIASQRDISIADRFPG